MTASPAICRSAMSDFSAPRAYGFSLTVLHPHAPPFAALAVAAAAAVVLALSPTPLFPSSGAYFSIAISAAALALLQVVSNPNLEEITKGPYGISLSGVFNPTLGYATALAILALTLALVIYLRNSHFGMALQAIREDPISAGTADSRGTRARDRLAVSALIAGSRRGVFAWYVSVFYPQTVSSVEFTIFAIVFALFGGNATVVGPILGVVILYGIYNAVGISTPAIFSVPYGALIMGLVLFLPNGIVSLLQKWGIDVPSPRAATERRRHFGGFRKPLDVLSFEVGSGRVLRGRTEGIGQDDDQLPPRLLSAWMGRRDPVRRTLDRRLAVAPAGACRQSRTVPRPFLTLSARQNVE